MSVPTLASGTLLANRFVIDALRDGGATADIYRGVDVNQNQVVALKVLREHDPVTRQRFFRESEILANLAHPWIVRYVAHGESRGLSYLAMEWLEGESLSRMLSRRQLTIDETVRLGRHIASALACVHRARVAHGDVKPRNLFLVGRDVADVRLLDFGAAHRQQRGEAGELIGTPAYLAPERLKGAKAATASADIFGVGCLLYECLAGNHPFEAEHPVALHGNILFRDPRPLAELRPDVPAELADLIERMLSKRPGERPQGGDELLTCVRRVSATLDGGSGSARSGGAAAGVGTGSWPGAIGTASGDARPTAEQTSLIATRAGATPAPESALPEELRRWVTDPTGSPRAHALLMVAAARQRGALARVLVAGAQARVQIWRARPDTGHQSQPHHYIASCVRRQFGLLPGMPLAVRRHELRHGLAQSMSGPVLEHAAAFLGEIASAPFSSDESPWLEEARDRPDRMAHEVSWAWQNWVRASCAAGGPLLILLEEVHRADSASVEAVRATLGPCAGVPLMVVALVDPSHAQRVLGAWRREAFDEVLERGAASV